MIDYEKQAREFLERESEFRLGFLSSEECNPLTGKMDEDFAESTEKGVRTLLSCDEALLPILRQTLERPEFFQMRAAMKRALDRNGRIVFSGCGATGRVSLILESAWRAAHPGDNHVFSIITGGEFAFVRAVEYFEDYAEVGSRQLRELSVSAGDVLVGITATGETASIVGSAREAARLGCSVFMLICVDRDIVADRLRRCRELYSLPNVVAIDMKIGGMALAGSTRMQSSTIEMIVAAAALEMASGAPACDYALEYAGMIRALQTPESVAALAQCIDFEYSAYGRGELIDYLSEDFLLDVIADTTERSPTFMIPPYRKIGEKNAPEPWALARNPGLSTEEVWRTCLKRDPRCIEWTAEEYEKSGLEKLLAKGIPEISCKDLMAIKIGKEQLRSRENALQVNISEDPQGGIRVGGRKIGKKLPENPMRIFQHVQVKLAMNIISTGTMVRMGRVCGNYMVYFNVSNKKLVDRACRIIARLCGVSYETACLELFKTMADEKKYESPVFETIARLGKIPG